ncbi:uncharacterized protein LOC130710858 [Lotus japonicus]|uniref:uncharacterized protein LOC130710858 n=1 Tax=Lotus japonicus TaxID=34305 RepID=UPI00258CBCBB|nr:uncharacterized protein LOC130710858 [Lotus japonicus]XP_057416223.1 uncharacterized protein LOC130710858 [Lotus japonicus]
MPPKTRGATRATTSRNVIPQPDDPPLRDLVGSRGGGRRGGTRAGERRFVANVFNVQVPRRRRGTIGAIDLSDNEPITNEAEQTLGDGQQLQIVTGQQTEVGVRGQQLVGATQGIAVTLIDFMKLKPPTFSGSGTSDEPQRFIDALERLWRALGCTDTRAVELASFQLEGVARDWYNVLTRAKPVGSPPWTWADFSAEFMNCFLPQSVRDGFVRDFERLEQAEGMTVSEYSAHFTHLSRYVPYPLPEEERVKRFVRGLKEYLFKSVVGSKSSTFSEVLSLALLVEQRQKEKGSATQNSQKRPRFEGSHGTHSSQGSGFTPRHQGHSRTVVSGSASSGHSSGFVQNRRSDFGGSSRSVTPQRHSGARATSCPTCGKFHSGTCFGDNRVCY